MGPCGQAPTDHTAFAGFLVEAGIDSMSVGPETFLRVKRHVATAAAGRRACKLTEGGAGSNAQPGIVLLESDRRRAGLEKI